MLHVDKDFIKKHKDKALKDRMSARNTPNFISSTMRRLAFMEQGRKR
ncbi:hypothetical protein [Bacillus sp. B15-48]|nr:hypothetical protein [Bacillus sp. B15-48]MBM4765201.1 hypothetical protein [Bacillus sp. B15-48]